MLQDGDTAAVAEKLDDLQGVLVHSLTGVCPGCKLICITYTSSASGNYGCLYAFTVGEDGDILNLGEKKKKKKKKQTSEVVVRSTNMQNFLAYTVRARLPR